MLDVAVFFGVFVLGVIIGVGFANQIYVARHKTYTAQIDQALDSIGIKRTEFLTVVADVKALEIRIRQLEVARPRSR